MPVDPKTGKGTRVKVKTDDKGKKIRVAEERRRDPGAERKAARS